MFGLTFPFNPFVPNAHFLNPLKLSENRKVFLCFQEIEKGCIGNEEVKVDWATYFTSLAKLTFKKIGA